MAAYVSDYKAFSIIQEALIMSIALCKPNYVKLKKFVERMGAFTGRTHQFQLHAQHAGLAHDLRRARNPFASQQIRKIG